MGGGGGGGGVTRSEVSRFALSLIPRVPEYEARLLQNNINKT